MNRLITTLSSYVIAALFIAVCPRAASNDEDDWFIRPEAPPKIKGIIRRGSSSARQPSFLEPPAIPLRRSERKRPPAPDNLIAKAIWGKEATFTSSSGSVLPIADWNLVTVDAERFVDEARVLGRPFNWGSVNLSEFSYDPLKTPGLLFSGVRKLRLQEKELERLRQYIMDGGMVICDSIYGSPYFFDSATEMFAKAFPEKRFRSIPPDHPLLHIFHTIDHVVIPEQPAETRPALYGIYVGSRIGVLISQYGLGTGWHGDQSIMKDLKARQLHPAYYDSESARRIGVNIAAYMLGYTDAAQAEHEPRNPAFSGNVQPTDELVFAQVTHDGAWDVHPGAASALLTRLGRETTLRLSLQRAVVDPATDDLSVYPFLYLTGLDDFTFSDAALSALRAFLLNGGVLLANNGLGLSTFHTAVTREIGRLLPDSELKPISPDHQIFTSLFDAIPASYSSSLLMVRPDLGTTPQLFGAEISGDLRVIYSPYDLEAGWLNTFYPLLRGYENESSQQLAMNILIYVITQ